MNFNSAKLSKLLYVILVAACILLTLLMYKQRHTRKLFKQAAKLTFYNIQPDQVADGKYRGKVYTNFLHVQLDVTVLDHKITKIDIIENEGAYGKKIDPLLDEIIAQNNSVVPAVKGEELASIVFISCVDDALFKGITEERKAELTAKAQEVQNARVQN